MIRSINPATGDLIGEFQPATDSELNEAATTAFASWRSWRDVRFNRRGEVLLGAATLLEQRTEALALLMAAEMGKPIEQGRAEIGKCAWVCRHYAEHGESYLADEAVITEHREAFISCRPLGPVLAVMPWNFPFWQVFRAAAPTLMAGNVMLLKHASNVSGCALAIADLWRDAGVPEGGFTTLLTDADGVARLIGNAAIKAVTLTGSTGAGRAVGSTAGQNLKKVVLELGGSDPYLVLADADIAMAAKICASSRLINSGQSCIAAKRFIVLREIAAEFEAAFIERLDLQHADLMQGIMQTGQLPDETKEAFEKVAKDLSEAYVA